MTLSLPSVSLAVTPPNFGFVAGVIAPPHAVQPVVAECSDANFVVVVGNGSVIRLCDASIDKDEGAIEFDPAVPEFVLDADYGDEPLEIDQTIQFAPEPKESLHLDAEGLFDIGPIQEPVSKDRIATEVRVGAKKIKKQFNITTKPSPTSVDQWYIPNESLTVQQLARRERIRKCLNFYYSRLLNTRDDSPWSMMHHMIAWGADARIWVGGYGGREVSCIGWLSANGECENERLITLDAGTLTPRMGPGLQGHEGQLLAMYAQARVRSNQPISVEGYDFTVQNLIDREQATCVGNTELTFKLIGLAHYLGSDATWQCNQGEQWSIERLIQEEIRQPINGVTCGGTHRLMGMSYAVRRRMQDGLPIDGQFARAAKYTADYRDFAFQMRNPDGTFSTDFFRSRRDQGDMDRKLKTTGHILEWVIFSSNHSELNDPRLERVVDILTGWLVENRYYDWSKGPLGHAIRALALYDERVYGGKPGERDLHVAANPPRIRSRTHKTASRPTPRKNVQPEPTKTPTPRRRIFRRSR